MNNKAFYDILITGIVIIFVLTFYVGAFAGNKELQCYSFDQYLEGVSTYYQMVPKFYY